MSGRVGARFAAQSEWRIVNDARTTGSAPIGP